MNPRAMKLWQIDALGLGACAALAAVWYAAGLQPLAQAKAQRLSMVDELAARQDQANKAEQSRHAAETRLASLRAQADQSEVHLESPHALAKRLDDLSSLAAEQRLTVEEVKPGATTNTTRFTTIAITMSGAGTAIDCALFLQAVRARFPDVGVTNFDLRGEPENTERPAHFSFSLVWYAAPPGAPVPK